jgi:hypothetical protein
MFYADSFFTFTFFKRHYLAFLTIDAPKYIPIIAESKCVSKGVKTNPLSDCQVTVSVPSVINRKPGFHCVYPTVTATSGQNTATTLGQTIIAPTAASAIIRRVI